MRKLFLSAFILFSFCCSAQNFYLFIGTYSTAGSKGIYVYRFDATTGTAEWVSNTDSAKNPSYLAVAPNQKMVYAVNETGPGKVSAYTFDKANGKLTFVNQQLTGGNDPCYVSVSKDNKWALVANYSGGSASAFPLNSDGSLKPYAQLFQDSGSSVNKQRQEKAHVHSAIFSPAQDYVFTPDLGLDKVMVYKFNPSAPKPLMPANPSFVTVTGGDGPRHLAFHPNQKFVYLIEEMSGTVGAYQYANGKLTLIQHLPTHPEDFKGEIGSADIHVSSDGKFLYASNRGAENTITIFSIDAATGKLKLVGYQPVMGKTPRNFIIDPTGNYLLVANQNSENVVIFKRDKQTGLLKATGKEIKVSMPVCLQMISK